jgi:hypothetical protein
MATQRKRARNLSLSEEVVEKAEALQQAETRPSLSNLVEALIVREHQRLGLPASTKRPSTQEVAA